MIKRLLYESQIITNIFIADTFIKRFTGYMFRKKPQYEAILITPCNSIHTFFMKFNIDVLFIDKNMEILKKIEGLRPGKVIMPIRGGVFVLEAKSGTFNSLKEGKKIRIEQ